MYICLCVCVYVSYMYVIYICFICLILSRSSSNIVATYNLVNKIQRRNYRKKSDRRRDFLYYCFHLLLMKDTTFFIKHNLNIRTT